MILILNRMYILEQLQKTQKNMKCLWRWEFMKNNSVDYTYENELYVKDEDEKIREGMNLYFFL